MIQQALSFETPAAPLPERFAAFIEFHRSNPEIYQWFKHFAHQALQAGRAKYGAHGIGERIRWHVQVDTQSRDNFKLNDHHLPYYARLLMLTDDRFAGFFERRDARFDATDEMILRHCRT